MWSLFKALRGFVFHVGSARSSWFCCGLVFEMMVEWSMLCLGQGSMIGGRGVKLGGRCFQNVN